MDLLKRIGFVLVICAAACGGLKQELADTPQQRIAKLQTQLNDCKAENQRLKGGGAGVAASTQPAEPPNLREQLADTPQKQIDDLNAQLAACEADNQGLRARANPAK